MAAVSFSKPRVEMADLHVLVKRRMIKGEILEAAGWESCGIRGLYPVLKQAQRHNLNV